MLFNRGNHDKSRLEQINNRMSSARLPTHKKIYLIKNGNNGDERKSKQNKKEQKEAEEVKEAEEAEEAEEEEEEDEFHIEIQLPVPRILTIGCFPEKFNRAAYFQDFHAHKSSRKRRTRKTSDRIEETEN